jgi:hypothetical protein
MPETPFIGPAAFRDEVEVEIRALLIARGHDVNSDGPVPIAPDDQELQGAIFRWQQTTNQVRAMLGLQAVTPTHPAARG